MALDRLSREMTAPRGDVHGLRGRVASVLAGTLPADLDERVELLAMVELFSACTYQELVAIATHTEEIRVPSGTALTVEGEEGDEFFVLAEGLAWATVGDDKVGSVRPGQCFGEMALLDGGERAATVTTELPSRLLVLDRACFQSLVRGFPTVTEKILCILAQRLRSVEHDGRGRRLAVVSPGR